VLLRLAYLTVSNAFTVLHLLPMSDREKDAEILALHHQLAVLERQLGMEKARFTPSDRIFLAALLRRLPKDVLRRLRLLVQRAQSGTRMGRPPTGMTGDPGESSIPRHHRPANRRQRKDLRRHPRPNQLQSRLCRRRHTGRISRRGRAELSQHTLPHRARNLHTHTPTCPSWMVKRRNRSQPRSARSSPRPYGDVPGIDPRRARRVQTRHRRTNGTAEPRKAGGYDRREGGRHALKLFAPIEELGALALALAVQRQETKMHGDMRSAEGTTGSVR
jgi:hypothetical protein